MPKKITAGDIKEAEAAALWFKDIFGEDFYFELQRHKTNRPPDANTEAYPLQEKVNTELVQMGGQRLGIKVIATNDVHFTNEEDADAHDRLICLSTGKDFDDPKRMRYTKQEWLKTTAEMRQIFSDHPEVLENTLEIANKVEFYSIDSDALMPFFLLMSHLGRKKDIGSCIRQKTL